MSTITPTSTKVLLSILAIQMYYSEIQLNSLCADMGKPRSCAVSLGQVGISGLILVHLSALYVGKKGNNSLGVEYRKLNQGHQ